MTGIAARLALAGLAALLPGEAWSTAVYTSQDGQRQFDVARCDNFFGRAPDGTAAQRDCKSNWKVLDNFQPDQLADDVWYTSSSDPDVTRTNHLVCNQQHGVCDAIQELQSNSAECDALYTGCRSALRHLHAMMFNKSPQTTAGPEQVCNNFARKSVRGFFHDFMSNQIDGSILSEHNISINFGLCRWTQYVNVLSDHTQCDPGSIIAMAGQLGFKACGVEIWEQDQDVKPYVTLNRGYSCGPNLAAELTDSISGQRLDQFSDIQASANATAMEEFWYATNRHFDRPDGEIEYSAEAGGAAHAIGRVTCQPDGVNTDGNPISFKEGFFHKQRTARTTEKAFYNEAISKMQSTQCDTVGGENRPTGAMRLNTDVWPLVDGETDINPEGGFCGMPTQFLGTVSVGSQHRVPRWFANTENTALDGATPYSAHQPCKEQMSMFIPWELLNMSQVALPSSPALERFRAIAWDGHDRIDSEWDSCEVGCAIPVLENRFCGGAGLSQYDWADPYCDAGISGPDRTCCAAGCGACADVGCSSRPGGDAACCPAEIAAAGRECTSAWDDGCLVPKLGDGAVCSSPDSCSSGSCRGGRCCNPYGQRAGTTACDVSGNAVACAPGYVLDSTVCVDECACSAGTAACSGCGVSAQCESSHYLSAGKCIPKVAVGGVCTAGSQCTSGDCRSGNCCDPSQLKPGCTDCNYRGLCDACSSGYTLCGHVLEGQGQCNVTTSTVTTTFKCGTGGPDTDWPSSDHYNYCGMAPHCPGQRAGCYSTWQIEHSCWVGSIADKYLHDSWYEYCNDKDDHCVDIRIDYTPPEFVGLNTNATTCACGIPARRGHRALAP